MESQAEAFESDYEYQYDNSETEEFLVDLDLSTLYGPTEPTKSRTILQASKRSKIQGRASRDDARNGLGDEDRIAQSMTKPANRQVLDNEPRKTSTSVQLLGLDTTEPLVSYSDQIYQCSWSDTVGTNIFFSSATSDSHPVKKQSLLGSSRIKLLGHRADLKKTVPQKRASSVDTNNRSLLAIVPGTGQDQTELNEQATFLEQFMDVKKRRGEADLVTVMPGVKVPHPHANDSSAEMRIPEIDGLNRRILKGDEEALTQLRALGSLSEGTIDQSRSAPLPAVNASDGLQPPSAANLSPIQASNDHG